MKLHFTETSVINAAEFILKLFVLFCFKYLFCQLLSCKNALENFSYECLKEKELISREHYCIILELTSFVLFFLVQKTLLLPNKIVLKLNICICYIFILIKVYSGYNQ